MWTRNNKDYDFVSQPSGNQAMIFNINIVRKVGFFDERFTSIHCQEFDYFIRCVKYLGTRCSINDDHYNVKSFNPIGNVIIESTHSGDNINNQEESINLRNNKYNLIKGEIIDLEKISLTTPAMKEINWYPFFWDKFEGNIKETFLDEYYNYIRPLDYDKIYDYDSLETFINKLAWWIPIKELRENFRNKFKIIP